MEVVVAVVGLGPKFETWNSFTGRRNSVRAPPRRRVQKPVMTNKLTWSLREAVNRSASQKNTPTFTGLLSSFRKSLPAADFLGSMNVVTPVSLFSKIHVNVIFPLATRSSKWSLPLMLLTEVLMYFRCWTCLACAVPILFFTIFSV